MKTLIKLRQAQSLRKSQQFYDDDVIQNKRYNSGRAKRCEESNYFILHDLTWHALAVMSEGVSGEKAGLRAAPT